MKKLVAVLVVMLLISVWAIWWFGSVADELGRIIEEQGTELKAALKREQKLRRSVAEILKKRRDESMQDPMLLNGKPRCTLIQKFNGKVVVVVPGSMEKLYFNNVDEAAHGVEEKGWVVAVSHPTIRKEV
jgi:hypothetical protein